MPKTGTYGLTKVLTSIDIKSLYNANITDICMYVPTTNSTSYEKEKKSLTIGTTIRTQNLQ